MAAEPRTPENFPGAAYARWKKLRPDDQTIETLHECINEAVLARMQAESSRPGITGMDQWRDDLIRVVQSAHFYWANVPFEILYLSALLWWLAWPCLRGSHWIRHYLHLALFPVLFYLPYWLGYCIASMPPWGPGGGILYPWLLWFSQPSWITTGLDWHFLLAVPPLLSVINQGSSLTFHDFALFHTSVDLHGPVDVALRSLMLVGSIGVVHFLLAHVRIGRKEARVGKSDVG